MQRVKYLLKKMYNLGLYEVRAKCKNKGITVERERETCLFSTPRVGLQPYKVRNTKYRINQTGI